MRKFRGAFAPCTGHKPEQWTIVHYYMCVCVFVGKRLFRCDALLYNQVNAIFVFNGEIQLNFIHNKIMRSLNACPNHDETHTRTQTLFFPLSLWHCTIATGSFGPLAVNALLPRTSIVIDAFNLIKLFNIHNWTLRPSTSYDFMLFKFLHTEKCMFKLAMVLDKMIEQKNW